MTSNKKKLFSICFKSCYAIFIGIGLVTIFSILLASYAGLQKQEVVVESSPQLTMEHISFPEDEAMLEAMSEQLAREAQALSEVMPAAGDAE